jgi:serine/threonine protein phosphatase PrpC
VLAKPDWDCQGSTAVLVYCVGPDLWTANVGDSRAILVGTRGSEPVPLTWDHKASVDEERARIESMGGDIKWMGDSHDGAYVINGNMSLSRAIGDRDEKPVISATPTIQKFRRNLASDRFVVLASDGLWDVMSSEQVAAYVSEALDKGGSESEIATRLAHSAVEAGSDDNVSVVILML